ncbi:MAG: hypothetical protein ACREQJ_05990 [Candidatus Binatia bacterium]
MGDRARVARLSGWLALFALLLALACATTEPSPITPVAAAPATPPEPPAVKVRVKKVDGRFVVELVDVRGAPRNHGVVHMQWLVGDRAQVVDPSAAPHP